MKRITSLLDDWGRFVSRNIDFADEMGESILYRAIQMGGYVEQGDSKDKILCEDMPAHLKKVDRAVRLLPRWERDCITMYYCAPIKPLDGQVWTKRELADLLNISFKKFDSYLSYGKKRLNKQLGG